MAKDLRTDHNLYIIGAGFSTDAGMPLMNDFLLKMRDSRDWLNDVGRSEEASAVNSVLDFRLKATAASYWVTLDLENIEELFSLAAASDRELEKQARVAIAATLDFARTMNGDLHRTFSVQGTSQIFSSTPNKHCNPAWAPPVGNQNAIQGQDHGPFSIDLYALYVARLLGMFVNGQHPVGENTFITFNYDTLLEESCKHLGLGFDYGIDSSKLGFDESFSMPKNSPLIPILKLHGSVNWANSPDHSKLTAFGDYHGLRKKNMIPELVPPTWRKVFENPLEEVWKTAIDRLRTATRIIIIGFSMPETDLHFKYLLAEGLRENISLREIVFVNPDETDQLPARMGSLLRQSYIDSGRISRMKMKLNQFCCGSVGSELHRFGRPVNEVGVRISP